MVGKRQPVKHGTIGGYVTHKRRGQEACGACRQAWRMYYQRRNDGLPKFVRVARTKEDKLKARLAAERREHEMRLNRERQARFQAKRRASGAEDQTVGVEPVAELPPQDSDAVLDRAPEEQAPGNPAPEQG